LLSIFSLSNGTFKAGQNQRQIKGCRAATIIKDFPGLKQRCWGRHFWVRDCFCVSSADVHREGVKAELSAALAPEADDNPEIGP